MYKKNAFSLCFGSRLSFARICISKAGKPVRYPNLSGPWRSRPSGIWIWTSAFGRNRMAWNQVLPTLLHTDLDRLFLVPFPWVNEEKDHFEEEEADALINFVEHLDFDEFVVPSVAPNWNAQIESNWLISCLQFPRSEICNFAKPWVSKPWYTNSVSGYNWKHFFEHSHWC